MIKQDRNYLTIVLLSFVTCGIYWFYYIYEVARDTNILCQGDGDETPGFASYFFLSIITCGVYTYYWYYKLGDRMHKNAPRYNLEISETGSTILLFMLINLISGGIGTLLTGYYITRNLNAMSAAYNQYFSGGLSNQPPQLGE